MKLANLQLPQRLVSLINEGHWPTESSQVHGQDFDPIIAEELVAEVFPGETRFCFAVPPFSLVADLTHEHACFWDLQVARPDQISRDQSLVIADFQLGSDSAVILDYAENSEDPPVKWLRWDRTYRNRSVFTLGRRREPNNEWVTTCRNFSELADRLQLDRHRLPRHTTNSERGGAIRPLVEPEGGEKPQLESERHSR